MWLSQRLLLIKLRPLFNPFLHNKRLIYLNALEWLKAEDSKRMLKPPRFLKKFFKTTPLHWYQVTRERTRLAVAIAGIAFADMLIFIQMGFEGALFDAAVQPHRNLDADLVLINLQMETLFSVKAFARERLYQVLAHPDVESVNGIYIATGQWKNPETRKERAILVWGIDPGVSSFMFPEVTQKQDKIQSLNHVLFDQAG